MKGFITIMMIALAAMINASALRELSLEDSIESAISNNKDLRAERMSVEVSSWQKRNTMSNFLPKAYLNTTAVRIDDKTYDRARETVKIPVLSFADDSFTGNYVPFSAGTFQGLYKTSYRTNIVVQQPLFAGGKITLGYRISRLANSIAESNYTRKESDVIYQITGLYFNILKLKELRDITDNSISSALTQRDRVLQMKELGMARESDVLQWEVRLQERRQSLLEIEDNILILNDLWNDMIGTEGMTPAPINTDNYLPDIKSLSEYNETRTEEYIEDTISEVRINNPLLQVLNKSKKIRRSSYRIAQGNFLPNLSLQFSYEIDDGDKLDFSGNKSWNIAAVLSLPLFQGGANYTQLHIARNEMRQAELSAGAAEDYLLNETRRIVRSLIRLAKNVEGNELNLSLNQATYDSLRELHRQGMLTNNELLDAENMLRAGQMQYASSIYDFIIGKHELLSLGVDDITP